MLVLPALGLRLHKNDKKLLKMRQLLFHDDENRETFISPAFCFEGFYRYHKNLFMFNVE